MLTTSKDNPTFIDAHITEATHEMRMAALEGKSIDPDDLLRLSKMIEALIEERDQLKHTIYAQEQMIDSFTDDFASINYQRHGKGVLAD